MQRLVTIGYERATMEVFLQALQDADALKAGGYYTTFFQAYDAHLATPSVL